MASAWPRRYSRRARSLHVDGGGHRGLDQRPLIVNAGRSGRAEVVHIVIKRLAHVVFAPTGDAEYRHRCKLACRPELCRVRDTLRDLAVKRGQLRRQWMRKKACSDLDYHASAGHAGEWLQRLFVERMAEQIKAHRLQNLAAALPEQFLPLETAQQFAKPFIGARDDDAALIEQRQRVLRGAPVLRAARVLALE